MSTRRWLRMSWWNAVLALVVLAGAVAMAVLAVVVIVAVVRVGMLHRSAREW